MLRLSRERLLPPVLGFVDGILNALTIAGSSIVHQEPELSWGLSLRIGGFALVTSWFVLFVAGYAQFRTDLVRSARELNLVSHGKLAQTSLGRAVMVEALADATVGSVASFLGAVLPLAVAVILPAYSWLAALVGVALLAGLGVVLARTMQGRPLLWALTLAAGGAALTAIGLQLRIA